MNPESLTDALQKRDSFEEMWKLLAPKEDFKDLYRICMTRWNRIPYHRQQQLYWFIREKKRNGEATYDNPLYAITYTKPHPYDWNGKQGIKKMMETKKMVSAFYDGHFGIYTQLEATIFEMTNQQKLN